MSMRKTGVVGIALAAVLALVFASASVSSPAATAPIYFGMDAPLTGPTQLVGQSDRQAVDAVVAYWNARGGVNGRRVVVDVLDNASNPSQAVQNVQKFIGDPKYVGIFGSGNAAAAVATGPIASQARIPFIALSPPTQLVEPPKPYAYILTATARLYAYSEAAYLKSLGIKRVWLMGDNGGYGRDGPSQVAKLAKAYGLEIVDTTIFSPASTDFSAELTQASRAPRAQALWLWTATPAGRDDRQAVQAAPAAATARADGRERLTAVPPGHVRRRGRRHHQLLPRARPGRPSRRSNPVRTQAALLRSILRRPVSNFDGDTAGALWAYKAAVERGGVTRARHQQRARDEDTGSRHARGTDLPLTTNHRASRSGRCGLA